MSSVSLPLPPAASTRLLTRREAAEYLGLSVQTLTNWASTGRDGIPYIRVSPRAVRYRLADLDAWLAARTQTHTGQASDSAE